MTLQRAHCRVSYANKFQTPSTFYFHIDRFEWTKRLFFPLHYFPLHLTRHLYSEMRRFGIGVCGMALCSHGHGHSVDGPACHSQC